MDANANDEPVVPAEADDQPAPAPDAPIDYEPPHGAGRHPFRDARGLVVESATAAEVATGEHEETEEEVRAGLMRRIARIIGGFLLIGTGIALLPLPGPGWLIIIIGLALLPYAWAQRTIVQIRRRIPGIPEEGTIPVSTWIIMGLMVAAFATISILFGKQLGQWLGDLWESIWS